MLRIALVAALMLLANQAAAQEVLPFPPPSELSAC
jgi:hypothetical protein